METGDTIFASLGVRSKVIAAETGNAKNKAPANKNFGIFENLAFHSLALDIVCYTDNVKTLSASEGGFLFNENSAFDELSYHQVDYTRFFEKLV